jgi:hypothetical protein
MEKLGIKHLAPYLPYGLKGSWTETFEIETLIGFCEDEVITNVEQFPLKDFKPILRPLSDLTKEIGCNDIKFIPLEELAKLFYYKSRSKYETTHFNRARETFNHIPPTYTVNCCVENDSNRYMYYSINKDMELNNYNVVQRLLEFHFDVFGLIEKGLAIDINTL